MTDGDQALLLHEYRLDIAKSPATTRATLKRLFEDVMQALEEHGRINIFVEKAAT